VVTNHLLALCRRLTPRCSYLPNRSAQIAPSFITVALASATDACAVWMM